MLLAISTSRGIHAESTRRPPARRRRRPATAHGPAGRRAVAAAPPNRRWRPRSSSARTPMARSSRSMSASSASPSSAAQAVADVAELAEQRRRGVAGGRPHELDERDAARPERWAVGEDPLQPGDGLVVARPVGEDPVVDELAQRPDGRVLVGDPGQEQLLEPARRRDRAGASDPGTRVRTGRAADRRRSRPRRPRTASSAAAIDGRPRWRS